MSDEAGDADLRRRAAWLLALLAIVAVLVVVGLVTLLHTSSGSKNAGAPDDSYAASSSAPAKTSPTSSASRSSASSSASRTTSPLSCTKLCVVDGDPGNSQDAINQLRAQHGRTHIDVSVSKAAQHCALTQGTNCKGGWAETQVPSSKGKTAVSKIAPLAKLLDPKLKSVEVGWAYDPNGHQYYFAVIRGN